MVASDLFLVTGWTLNTSIMRNLKFCMTSIYTCQIYLPKFQANRRTLHLDDFAWISLRQALNCKSAIVIKFMNILKYDIMLGIAWIIVIFFHPCHTFYLWNSNEKDNCLDTIRDIVPRASVTSCVWVISVIRIILQFPKFCQLNFEFSPRSPPVRRPFH